MTAPGAAPAWVLRQVAGPQRPARVLHAGRSAVHVAVDGSCVSVLARGAVALPCGVRTALPALPVVPPASVVTVGDSTVWLPGVTVRVRRDPDPAVPHLSPRALRAAAHMTRAWEGARLDAVRELLPAGALDALAAGDPAAVPALLGLGPGLTPLGDDVLAGWLAAAVAVGHPGLGRVKDAVSRSARARTTTLSATLLDCAGRGETLPELRSLLLGVMRQDGRVAARSLGALLEVGDTSGGGLALGTVLALQRPAARAA